MNRMSPVKKVAAIHDLSGVGRASLTAIIPILSSMGVQVCPIPTAILSSHTGGYENFTYVDLTDTMEAYIDQWKELDMQFDCIYSGFLGSVRQIEIVSKAFRLFSTPDNFVVVDPVMGDDGALYATMNLDMVEAMRHLVQQADIITPNFTEAALLLGREYRLDIEEDTIKDWLKDLSDLGPRIVILTSVPHEEFSKRTSVIAYNRDTEAYWKVSCDYIPASYPGTGDAYTSVLIGSLLQGDSLPMAMERGVQFITTGIKASYGFDYPKREGVLLERVLNTLGLPVMANSYELLK